MTPTDSPTDAVLRDLLDAVIQEALAPVRPGVPAPGTPAGDSWALIGALHARLVPGGALQAWRWAGGPVLDADGRALGPAEAVGALGLDGGHGARHLVADLHTAVAHAEVIAASGTDAGVRPGDLVAGERLAIRRGRPFHPTGRAVSGWTAADLAAFGPQRAEPLALSWVAVRRDRLRFGPGPDSGRLHELLLTPAESDELRTALVDAGLDEEDHQLLPVHPWHAEHVLPRWSDDPAVVPVPAGVGRFRPTASLRTLAVADAPDVHVKLPLGVATLGATRLLPPRYLDNGDRAERTMRALLERDPVLAALVDVCAEGTWSGWALPDGSDEFDDGPGQLAAQVRRYPAGALDGIVVPMAALAAPAWDEIGPALGVTDPVAFFGGLADGFVLMTVSFLRHGVLPEVHGQNVVVRLAPGGAVAGFLLRDHDALRLYPEWMRAAGVADPEYRLRPGARQSLRSSTAEELVSYAQTLGFQVNLYGIADAFARELGVDEAVLWARMRDAVERALATPDLPAPVTTVLDATLLRAPRWPSRTVLGPLLAAGRSAGVSMPAGVGSVPNPLPIGGPR